MSPGNRARRQLAHAVARGNCGGSKPKRRVAPGIAALAPALVIGLGLFLFACNTAGADRSWYQGAETVDGPWQLVQRRVNSAPSAREPDVTAARPAPSAHRAPEPSSAPATPAAAPPPPPHAAEPARPLGRTFVLAVGINRYDDPKIGALGFAEADARSVYAFFATARRSPSDPDRVRLVIGKDATRMNVLRAIREHLIERANRPDDTAILFFAGHGYADARQTYLAATDTVLDALPETAISRATLDEFWGQVVAQRVLLIDACHAGGLEGIRGIGGVSAAPSASENRSGGAARPGMSVLASGVNEVSVEDERFGNGVFTRALMNGLSGDADLDSNGFVSGEELSRYLQEEVPALARQVGGRQTPVVDAVDSHRMRLTR